VATLAVTRITVRGELLEHAQSRVTPGGAPELHLLIDVPGSEQAIAVCRQYRRGAANAALVANLAWQLRRGTPVTVHAARHTVALTPAPHLVLLDVQDILYPVPPSRHEPRDPLEFAI
jgi:hypothetical protein